MELLHYFFEMRNQASAKHGLLIFTKFVSFFLHFFVFQYTNAPTLSAFSTLTADRLDPGPRNLVWICTQIISGSTLKVKVMVKGQGQQVKNGYFRYYIMLLKPVRTNSMHLFSQHSCMTHTSSLLFLLMFEVLYNHE